MERSEPEVNPSWVGELRKKLQLLATLTSAVSRPEPEPGENLFMEGKLRKQLLLLATLVVGVTYMTEINPPGGVWQENGLGHKAGDAILLASHRRRYLVFCYGNATALAASVVVIFVLLLKKPRGGQLRAVQFAMVLDLVSLIVACAAGISRDLSSSAYTLALVACFPIAYIVSVLVKNCLGNHEEEMDGRATLKPKERSKVLMLLATFIAVITYVAGLNSSGGYRDRVQRKGKGNTPYNTGFRYCNSTAFMSSLFIVSMLQVKKLQVELLYMFGAVAPLGLLAAYATGTYVKAGVYGCILIGFIAYGIVVIVCITRHCGQSTPESADGIPVEASRKVKSLILLLAALTVTISYQAGLNPPGGIWPDDRDGHRAGFPILLSTHPWRYKVFTSCNTGAFVLSLAAILMLMVHKEIHTSLLVSMILDMVSLMVAYAAGTWMDARTSIYIVAMSGGVILYVMIHLLCATLRTSTDTDYTRLMKKRDKRLLLVAVLVASITYQAGLNPPGGFRRQEDDGHSAGAVLLVDSHPRIFWAFFCGNTVSFLATITLTLFFVSPNLHRIAIRCYALYTCIVLALLGLMVAGTVKTAGTYPFVIVVMLIPVIAIASITIMFRSLLLKKVEKEEDEEVNSAVVAPATVPRPRSAATIRRPRSRHRLRSAQETEYRQLYASHKYTMILAMLAAGATYQAGLAPPGGLWQDDGEHGDAGSPVLYYTNRHRYNAFFYSNSTSFVASVFVVALQLQQILYSRLFKNSKRALVLATRVALVLALLGLLAAYAAGTTWWHGNAILLVVVTVVCVAVHAAPWIPTMYSWMYQKARSVAGRPATEQP